MICDVRYLRYRRTWQINGLQKSVQEIENYFIKILILRTVKGLKFL
jgi:hypothetical protein